MQIEDFNHSLYQKGYPIKDMIVGVPFVEAVENQELHRRLQELARRNALPVKLSVLPIRDCHDASGFASNALALEAAHRGCDTYLFFAPSTIDYFDSQALHLIGEGFERGLCAMGGITSRDQSLIGTGHCVRNLSLFDANLFHVLGGFSVVGTTRLAGFGNLIVPKEGETSRLMVSIADYGLQRRRNGLFKQIDLTEIPSRHRAYDDGGAEDQAVFARTQTRLKRFNGSLPTDALRAIQDLAGDPMRL